MAWKDPTTAPTNGEFLAKFRSGRGTIRKVVLTRSESATGKFIGTAAGVFEFDLGEMLGWHPLPEDLE